MKEENEEEAKKPMPLSVAGKEVDLDNVAASTKDALKESQDERAEDRGIPTATVTNQGVEEVSDESPVVLVGRKPSRNRENINAFFEQAKRKKNGGK